MKYLFNNIEEVKKRIANKKIILFLDYDGTIVEIKKKPKLAILDSKTKNLLKQLSKKFIVCIVSGRELKDLKGLIKIKNIIYIGNHGFEGNVFKIKFKKKVISALYKELMKRLKIRGVIIEDKKFSISVHYRLVKKEEVKKLKKIFYEIVKKYKEIKVREGKKVLEILPKINWNKGNACLFLLKKFKKYPIYIGDDETDKDVFGLLKGINISVGKGAEFYVKNVREVREFLLILVKCWTLPSHPLP